MNSERFPYGTVHVINRLPCGFMRISRWFFRRYNADSAMHAEVTPSYGNNNARMQVFIRALHIGFAREEKEENIARADF